MYNKRKASKTTLKVNESVEGEPIERKVRRITQQQEPITDGAPQIFTERSEGVLAEHNIRTDRWELAVDAMDKVATNKLAKRKSAAGTKEGATATKGKSTTSPKAQKQDGGTPTGGSDNPTTGAGKE